MHFAYHMLSFTSPGSLFSVHVYARVRASTPQLAYKKLPRAALSQERPDKKWESLTQILGNLYFLSCYLRLKMHAKVGHFLLSILDIEALVC